MWSKRKIIQIGLLLLVAVSIFALKDVDASAKTRKQVFISRYNKVYKKCKKFKYDGSMYDMRQDALKEYKLWDKELNYIYKKIYNSLSYKAKKKLKKLQIAWIKKKEKKAKEAAEDGGGGSLGSLTYMEEQIKLTKKRIKWLINNYA